MAIDAQVSTVFIEEDGSGYLQLVDRPPARKGESSGCAGQSKLYFFKAPEEVTQLNGMNIWGASSMIMLGDIEIAARKSYTEIVFHSDLIFKSAVEAYWNKHGKANLVEQDGKA